MSNQVEIKKYKDAHLNHELKENLINRINRANGHLNSIKKMIEDNKACEEIVLQLTAVKSALNEIIVKIVEGHIEMCMENECSNLDTVELIKLLIRVLKSK